MPNRILRDWTDSDRVDLLTAEAERFFVRLIMKADDYGRYFADPKRLKAFLFPLKDTLRETDCTRWLAECEKAGLIRFYEVSGKRFVELQKFGQRLRNMRHLHPTPPFAATRGDAPPESETNQNPKRIEARRLCAARLEKLFGRTEIDVWTYIEETTLVELQKRPAFEAELTVIEGFHAKSPAYFPQSLTSLLTKWSETLDRARNYERNRRNDSKGNDRNAGTYNANTSSDGFKSKIR